MVSSCILISFLRRDFDILSCIKLYIVHNYYILGRASSFLNVSLLNSCMTSFVHVSKWHLYFDFFILSRHSFDILPCIKLYIVDRLLYCWKNVFIFNSKLNTRITCLVHASKWHLENLKR